MTTIDQGTAPSRTCCAWPDLPHPGGLCPDPAPSPRLRPINVEPLERRTMFGVEVTAITSPDMLALIGTHVGSRLPLTIFHQNLHSAYLQQKHQAVRTAYTSADVAYIDGMPFVVQGRLLGGSVDRSHRNTYLDWYDNLLTTAQEEGWRVFFLGGTAKALELGCATLTERFPDLVLEGHDGFFDASPNSADTLRVIDEINDFGADVVLVGMGMPRQELWVAANRRHLRVPVTVTVGAGMDYVAGLIPTPPRWMGKYGVEWMHRLVSEPRRLWHRYLVEPVHLIPVFVREVTHARFGRSPWRTKKNQQRRLDNGLTARAPVSEHGPYLRAVDRD